MARWKITTRDERDDPEPAREFIVEAEEEDQAWQMAVEAMHAWEKVAEIAPA